MFNRNDDPRGGKQKDPGGAVTLARTPRVFKGKWAYASVAEYNDLLVWYKGWHGVYHNSETGETYDPYFRILTDAREYELRELGKREHQALLREIRTRIYPEPPFISDIYINLETLQTYDPSTRTMSFIDTPSESRILSEEEHSQLLCEICIDVALAHYEEKEVSNRNAPASDRDVDVVVNKLLKLIKVGTAESIFLVDLLPGAPGTTLAALLEPGHIVRLKQIITSLEQGKCGVRWQTLNWEQKAVVVARLAMALRLVSNYLLKDERILWGQKVLPGVTLLHLASDQEISSVRALEDVDADFDPQKDDIADYFVNTRGEDGEREDDYLLIHGSFLFGAEKEQPGDIDLILSLLEGSRADKEIPYELILGRLEEGLTPADFARIYRVNDLHPGNRGSEMDAYLGIPLWGTKEIGTVIYEEWQSLLPDFRKLSEKVLDRSRKDSQSKRTRKLVDLAVICHHFLQWMNEEFEIDSFDSTFQEHVECVRELIEWSNATLTTASFALSWSRLSAKLAEIQQVEAYISQFMRLVRNAARRRRRGRRL